MTSALPYAHPRRATGPLRPHDRVKWYGPSGGLSHGTVLTEEILLPLHTEAEVVTVYVQWDDDSPNTPFLFAAEELIRFGRIPAPFQTRAQEAAR